MFFSSINLHCILCNKPSSQPQLVMISTLRRTKVTSYLVSVIEFCTFFFQPGSVQQLPKQLRLVVDVSGSMYRFNGLDGRLERVMEAACLVTEAFDKYEQRFKV